MLGKLLNIPTYVEDPSYRYKMPALQLKIEGKGNGIKTNIVNLVEVAKALRVPTDYPLKFLGHELGSLTLFKENKNEVTSIINGAFSEEELKKHLDKFIEKYVLCPNCKYPEMVLRVRKGTVCGSCNSCGAKPLLDNNHKLATFILKNPPKNVSEFKTDEKETDKEKEKEKDKDAKGKKNGKDDKKEKVKDDKKKPDAEPVSEEHKVAEKKVAHKETFTIANMEPYTQKVHDEYTKHAHESFENQKEDVSKILKALKNLKIPDNANDKASTILFNAVFSVNIAKEVQKNKEILEAFYDDFFFSDTEKEVDTLLNLQNYLLVKNKDLSFEKYVPTILKLFYDEDLLSEDLLVDWDDGKLTDTLKKDYRYSEEINEKFKEASRPIIDWLKSSE